MEQLAKHKQFVGPAGPVRPAGPDSMSHEAFDLFMELNRVADQGRPDPSKGTDP